MSDATICEHCRHPTVLHTFYFGEVFVRYVDGVEVEICPTRVLSGETR